MYKMTGQELLVTFPVCNPLVDPVQDGGDPVEGLPGTESTAGPHSTVRPYEVHTALIVLSKEVIVCWDLK